MSKYTAVTLLLLFLITLLPGVAQAVPVEPTTCLVQKEMNSGKIINLYSVAALYRDRFTIEKANPAPLSRSSHRPDVRKVIAEAKSLLGQPYAYGAEGPHSFDCSGFTRYVYKQVGVNLPHLASAQAQKGVRVDKSQLTSGDLVFFGYYGSSTIEHVGIYIGDGKFIHSSSKKGVIISSLTTGYYADNYKGATRIIPS